MNHTVEMSRANADAYIQSIREKHEAKISKDIDNFLGRMKIIEPNVHEPIVSESFHRNNLLSEDGPMGPSLFTPATLVVEHRTGISSKKEVQGPTLVKPLVLGGIRGKFINEDIITAKSKQRKNAPKFRVAIAEDEDGKVITKDYASQKSRIWGEFRKVEYERYKNQYKQAGKTPYWSDFQKLGSAVWASLNDDEKQDIVLNGSDIDWINL